MLRTFKYIGTKRGTSARCGKCLVMMFESTSNAKRSGEDMFTDLCGEFDPLGAKSDLYVDDFRLYRKTLSVKVVPKPVLISTSNTV